MAGTSQKYLNLKNVAIKMGSGLATDALSISIKRNPKYIDRTPGMALTDQAVYNGEGRPDITINGFNSDALTFGEIIPNDKITSFTLLDSDSEDVLQTDFFTKWPVAGWVFGEISTEFNGTECSKWVVPIIAGVLNPNAAPAGGGGSG